MTEIAVQYGFTFDHIGCPCSGSPKVYKAMRGTTPCLLTLWERRGVWKLVMNGYTVANGNAANLQSKLNEIWDSSNN